MWGGGRYPSMGLGRQATCSSPRGRGVEKRLVLGVDFGSVLESVVSGPGEGGLC